MVANIYDLEKDFEYIPTAFDETNLTMLKQIMHQQLTDYERRIFILYLNYGSCRKTEAVCNIKFRQIAVIVKTAKQKIKLEVERIKISNNRIIC